MKNLIKFLNREVLICDTFFKIKSVFMTFIWVGVFLTLAHASTMLRIVDVSPGTAGINWTVPTFASDISIQEISASNTTGTNWTQLSFFNSCTNGAGTTLNWSNLWTIQAGSSWHKDNMSDNCDTIAIRGQNNGQVDQISYVTQVGGNN